MVGSLHLPEPLWRFLRLNGRTSPVRYFAIGFSLTSLTVALDHVLATRVFRRP
jgi:hypothetical protein